MSDEYSRQAREQVDGFFGEGHFDDVLAESVINQMEFELDPDKLAEAEDQMASVGELLDTLLVRFATIHKAGHLGDRDYVDYCTAVLVNSLSDMPEALVRSLLFEALIDLGSVIAHQYDDLDGQQ